MKILLFANTDWYLYNFRRSLAEHLRDNGHQVVLLSPPGPYGTKLTELGFRWIPAPMERSSLNPLRELLFFGWLYRLLIREHFDVIHSFTIKCAVYGSLAGRLTHVRRNQIARINAVAGMGYVFTSASVKARLLRPIVRWLMKCALGGSDAMLVLQNPDDVALFRRHSIIPDSQVRLIPGSGVDCSRFKRPSPREVTGGRIRVLVAARLLWDKGLAELVEAIQLLKRDGRTIDFLLAGAPDLGNPASVPEQTVRGWHEAGLLTWLGHVDDMPSLLRTVDVVALPSYREGLPKGLIEAAAASIALVSTDVPGCRDVISDGVDGLLVPARNAAAFADALARLADDPDLREKLGHAARNKALREFDEQIILAKTAAVYHELRPTSYSRATIPTRFNN